MTQETEAKKEKKAKKLKKKDDRYRVLAGIFLLLFSLFLFIAFISYIFTWKIDQSFAWQNVFSDSGIKVANWAGKTGARMAQLFITQWFGVASFAFPFIFGLIGFKMLRIQLMPFFRTITLTIIGTILLSATFGFLFGGTFGYLGSGLGGGHGYFMAQWLNSFMGKIGTGFLLMLLTFTYIIFAFEGAWEYIISLFAPKEVLATEEGTTDLLGDESIVKPIEDIGKEITEDNIEIVFEKPTEETIDTLDVNPPIDDLNDVLLTGQGDSDEESAEDLLAKYGPYDPRLDLGDYKFPTIDLLADHKSGNVEVSNEDLVNNKNKIIETLKSYKIDIDKIKATIGPTVTLYEIIPAPGVRISKIKNLEDDIALSLAALGIRIIAPIPGKGTIGIEVPNRNPEIVSMRSVIASKKFQESTYDLPIALGKTVSNETFVVDLARMPHLLIAGATGQGKSVGINAIVASLLYKKHPSELKFVMVDPKKVELSLYSKIEKHYLAKLPTEEESIITEYDKVKSTLNSLVIEMENRYDLLKRANSKNIKEYNTKFIERRLNPDKGHRFLEYIVLIIDEFADLISVAGKEVEMPIARLAQKARAIGIHLIIATQRPSINVITGVIKANFPSRIAFRVVSSVDSRTILDHPGANQLIGRGDMLIMSGSDTFRVQCAFIDTPEIEKITEFIGKQRGYPDAMHLPEPPAEGGEDLSGFDNDKIDPMFADAARLIVSQQQGSTSLIQRKFSIGYNRAGRIMDQLQARGIVGQSEGSKARQVLITDLDSLENILRSLE
jgi:DNA segregation ATPase FtsK/SpoIIIE, S-DNA-T family